MKDGMGLRMKNLNMRFHWKIKFLGRGHEKPIYRGKLPKNEGGGGELGQFVDLRMGLAKRRGGGVFEGSRVGLIPQSMHTMV